MTQKPTGRPTMMTKATVLKLEAAFRDGFSIGMTCHASGISRSTHYDHINRNQDFSDKMELAWEWPTQRAKQVIIQAIDKGDLKAAQFWLERKARAEFAAFSLDYTDDLRKRWWDLPGEKLNECKQLLFRSKIIVQPDGNVYTPELSYI